MKGDGLKQALELEDIADALNLEGRPGNAKRGHCPKCGGSAFWVTLPGFSCGTDDGGGCGWRGSLEKLRVWVEARGNGGLTEPDKTRRLPLPMSVRDLIAIEDPAEEWLVEGLIPAGGNVVLAGYPKTFKTMVLLELAVSLATMTPFLGRYRVPTRRRSGLVLMEDMAHRVRRRLHRLCLARGVQLADLEGWLYVWCRPPLRLVDRTVTELADDAERLELDLLWIDSWAYVATGDSNSSDEVTPQLTAYSLARARQPGLTVGLTHHARKKPGGEGSGDRLTDLIRNSSAFGAWYDSGIVLARRDETAPVTLRAELRDHESPESIVFSVEDEHPATVDNGRRSSGWLRLTASAGDVDTLERRAAAEALVPAVREFLAANHGGVSRTRLREVPGTHADVEAAFRILESDDEAVYTPSPGPGRPANYALQGDPAEPCRNPAAAGAAGFRGGDSGRPAETRLGRVRSSARHRHRLGPRGLDMTPSERRERGTELCRRLAQDVAVIVPTGIGGWGPAWEFVAGPDADFLEAITRWEAHPTEEAKASVRTTYHAVVDAWREATQQYQRERAGR